MVLPGRRLANSTRSRHQGRHVFWSRLAFAMRASCMDGPWTGPMPLDSGPVSRFGAVTNSSMAYGLGPMAWPMAYGIGYGLWLQAYTATATFEHLKFSNGPNFFVRFLWSYGLWHGPMAIGHGDGWQLSVYRFSSAVGGAAGQLGPLGPLGSLCVCVGAPSLMALCAGGWCLFPPKWHWWRVQPCKARAWI